MSHNDSILNTLNLKDPHIKFDEKYYSEEIINHVECKIFSGVLSYAPDACPHCGHVFDPSITKHGFKTSRITLPKVSEFNTYLKLRKQRYYCRHCDQTFTLKTPIVKDNCFISNNTKLAVALKAKKKISEKDIASDYNVSHCTVSRTIDSFYQIYRPKKNFLPPHLSFDEFKSVKSAQGAMSFMFIDANSGRPIDIVEDRRIDHLIKYFMSYSKAARRSVMSIVIDMYVPYMQLIKKVFPNAHIILDRFHMVQLFTRAFNKTRVLAMKEHTAYHYKFKKYWKLLLKNHAELDCIHSYYRRCFKKHMRQIDIVEFLIDLDPVLKASYILYQEVLTAIKYRKDDLLESLLKASNPLVSDYIRTAIQSMIKHLDYAKNGLRYPFSNGRIEGLNNKIKVIKRIAFGYRSFYHFRNRILISFNIANLKTA
jgi:transposase